MSSLYAIPTLISVIVTFIAVSLFILENAICHDEDKITPEVLLKINSIKDGEKYKIFSIVFLACMSILVFPVIAITVTLTHQASLVEAGAITDNVMVPLVLFIVVSSALLVSASVPSIIVAKIALYQAKHHSKSTEKTSDTSKTAPTESFHEWLDTMTEPASNSSSTTPTKED